MCVFFASPLQKYFYITGADILEISWTARNIYHFLSFSLFIFLTFSDAFRCAYMLNQNIFQLQKENFPYHYLQSHWNWLQTRAVYSALGWPEEGWGSTDNGVSFCWCILNERTQENGSKRDSLQRRCVIICMYFYFGRMWGTKIRNFLVVYSVKKGPLAGWDVNFKEEMIKKLDGQRYTSSCNIL